MKIDLEALAQEFNVEMDKEFSMEQHQINVENINNTIHVENPNTIMSVNINKANAILDRIIKEINTSGMSPRLGEVASQLISTINVAVGQIYTKELDLSSLQLKKKMLDLKEREVIIKEISSKINKTDGGTVNNNIVVTDRETILKLLKQNKEEIRLLDTNN